MWKIYSLVSWGASTRLNSISLNFHCQVLWSENIFFNLGKKNNFKCKYDRGWKILKWMQDILLHCPKIISFLCFFCLFWGINIKIVGKGCWGWGKVLTIGTIYGEYQHEDWWYMLCCICTNERWRVWWGWWKGITWVLSILGTLVNSPCLNLLR